MPQRNRRAELAANEAGRALQSIHCLPRNMPVADNRNKNLAEHQILSYFAARNRSESHPRILDIQRHDLGERPLDLMIDPPQPLPLHKKNRPTARRKAFPAKRKPRTERTSTLLRSPKPETLQLPPACR